MNVVLRAVILFLCVGFFTSCAKPQAYVDPQYHKAGYEAIQRLAQPISAKIEAQFQRNGKPIPEANSELQGHVERTLRASGVFTPIKDQTAQATISVTANNIADLAAASAKGFKTGLTFYGSGSMVDDNYEFTFSYRDAAGKERMYTCQHAIHTALGNIEQPVGQTPTTLTDAFGRVVEDSTLNFIKDLQDAGLVQK
jgi:hypothetical protein